MRKPSKARVKERLKELKGWRLVGEGLQKKFKFRNFVETVDFVNRIVPIAEEIEHHPDLEIRNYDELTISITTHDVGGITKLDFELAERIGKLKSQPEESLELRPEVLVQDFVNVIKTPLHLQELYLP